MKGAFVGLATWDLIYVVDHLPALDEKIVATDAAMNAGGPATNAAVTFSHLGGDALLVSSVGSGSIATAIVEDLRSHDVHLHDIAPGGFQPPISSAFLKRESACRAVVSLNASKVSRTAPWDPHEVLQGCDMLLVDGHYLDAALCAAGWAASAQVPVVLDAGSWKPGTEGVLELCDVVIASSRFRPPGCGSKDEVLDYLVAAGVEQVAITDGALPVLCRDRDGVGSVATVPSTGVDTTGAGDVFHGAFCFCALQGLGFREALGEAAKVAACKSDHLGARSWLEKWQP